MSNDVRGLLHDAATTPSRRCRRGRSLAARAPDARRSACAVSGLAVVAIVAIGALAAVNVFPDDHESTPPARRARRARHLPTRTTHRRAVVGEVGEPRPSALPHL